MPTPHKPGRRAQGASSWTALAALALMGALVFPPAAGSSGPGDREAGYAAAAVAGGLIYEVSRFEVHAVGVHPDMPQAEAWGAMPLRLAGSDGIFLAPHDDDESNETVTLEMLAETGPHRFHETAVTSIIQQLSDGAAPPRYATVHGRVDPRQVDPATGADRREPDQATLTLVLDVTFSAFEVSGVDLAYVMDDPHPDLPGLDRLRTLRVALSRHDDAFVAPRAGMERHQSRLDELPEGRYYASALQQVSERLVSSFTDRGLMGVAAHPDAEDIRRAGEGQATVITYRLRVARVAEVRTVAMADHLEDERRRNRPEHASIRLLSPIKAGDLLRRPMLERYLHLVNRHPTRRVEVAVQRYYGAGEEGDVVVESMVFDTPP